MEEAATAEAALLPSGDVPDNTWGEVPDNILVHVFAFLHCRADRFIMALVNHYWRDAVLGLRRPAPPILPPLPPQLPWLFFPSIEEPTFYSPIARRYHRCRLPLDVRRARCCGSGDGGWLVLALDDPHAPRANLLYNLNSGQRIPLPPSFLPDRIPFNIRVAAVSSTRPYMIAAIALVADGSTAAFWSEGSEDWFSPLDDLRAARLRDVVCHGGVFLFLTAREDIIQFSPVHEDDPTGHATLRRGNDKVQRRPDYDDEDDYMHGEIVAIKRYLVVSRDGLLMVVRYQDDIADVTLRIRVFELCYPPRINCLRPNPVWEEYIDGQLDGRMLFLGRGCSMSFEAANYDGFEKSMIYFFDEDMVRAQPAADGTRLYLLHDMGRYSTEERTTHPWPPGHPGVSDNAPHLVAPLTHLPLILFLLFA